MADDKIFEAANSYAAAWCSDDGTIAINRGESIVGRAAVAEMAKGFHAEFPDLAVHLDHLRIAGSHVMFGWTLEGTHAGT